MPHARPVAWAVLLGVVGMASGLADATPPASRTPAEPRQESAAAASGRFPQRVFWGDTHLHTSNSLDAGVLFGCRIGPEDALRFARGGTVSSTTGVAAKLERPYDFLVVSDHSDYMGFFDALDSDSPELLGDPVGRQWHEKYRQGDAAGTRFLAQAFVRSLSTGRRFIDQPHIARSAWARAIRAAESYNEPGRFTAFIGYEWSSTPGGDNLHRNILYRDGAARALQVLPLTAFETQDPRELWKWMAAYEAKTGGKVLAIPHNGNLSGGRMFADRTYRGEPFDSAYAKERASREPVVEITQTKGDSETLPALSPGDDFSAFERWDRTNLFGTKPATPDQGKFSYVRPALTRGLGFAASLGVNPFKFGLVGGTDSHNGLSTVDADDFFGNRPASEPGPARTRADEAHPRTEAWQIASSGLTGVWAEENTREALFDAFARKEVYATTGPRITVRVFAGWNFGPEDARRADLAEVGYARGVPMGGDLVSPPRGAAPVLVIQAAKDPEGANLDRIQVIKGWLDSQGGTHDAVFNAAWSGARAADADGRLPLVGTTVDVTHATYTNTIGAPVLCAAWRDPAFNPREHAYYYVRVIEIPTPRWSTYDAARYGTALPADVPATVAQRAYTSPIWYEPR